MSIHMDEDLPDGWIWARLQDIVYPGGTRNPNNTAESSFLYVDIEALDNKMQRIASPKRFASDNAPGRARLVIHTNDIIFSLTRPYLKNLALIPPELDNQIASTAYCVMRPEEGISSQFVFYLVYRDDFIKSIPTYGDSPPAAHDDEFLAMEIPVAPSQEQARIVAAIEQQFSRLDDAVASLKAAQATAKQYRASLLASAVEGELTKEWRAANPASETGAQLLARILAERRARWEKEQLAKMRAKGITLKDEKWKLAYKEPQEPNVWDLPELPEGWCWATVEQVAQIQGGIQKQPARIPRQNAYPYLRVANVLRGRLDLTIIEKMELFGNELETLHLCKGDILVVEGNGSKTEIGRSALWNEEIKDCVHQNHIIRVRLNGISAKYVDFYWNSPEGSKRVTNVAASTTGLYTLSVGKISRLPIPLPSLAEQAQIVTEVEERLAEIARMEEAIEQSLRQAELERQHILQAAFTGQLVEQDPEDEPASVLLARIREERKLREEAEKERRKGERRVNKPKKKVTYQAGGAQLYRTLRAAGGPLEPHELFQQAGLKAEDQPEAVAMFYNDLARLAAPEIAAIEVARPDERKVLLTVREVAPEIERELLHENEIAAEEPEEAGETKAAPMLEMPTLWEQAGE